jgi:hypothetical protein
VGAERSVNRSVLQSNRIQRKVIICVQQTTVGDSSMTKREALGIIFLVSGWRAVLFLIAHLSQFFIAGKQEFTYPGTFLDAANNWWHSWGNFDGVHYHRILTDGYLNSASIQAFFPGYPLAARLLTPVLEDPFLILMITSHVFLLLFVLSWFWFAKTVYSSTVAWKSLLVVLLFPTSFYLGATYSESLFLLAVTLTFAAAWKGQYFWGALAAAVASATRVVGAFAAPALWLDSVLESRKLRERTSHQQLRALLKLSPSDWLKHLRTELRTTLLIALSATGLLAYMLYLHVHFGDPLLFLHVQSSFGAGRSDELILLPQVIWRQLKILATTTLDWRWFVYLEDLAFTLGALALLIIGYFRSRKLQLSWIVFSLGALLLPPLTGILSSMPRYVLVIFPLYLLIAEWLERQPKLIQIGYFAVSTLLLILNTMLFIQGHWVA